MQVLWHLVGWAMGVSRPWTWHTDEEQDALARHAAGRTRLVEIGCWQGVSTVRLRSVMAPDGTLYAIDPYPVGRLGFSAARLIAHHEVARVRRGTVRFMRMTDVEAAAQLDAEGAAPMDLIFSDAVNSFEGSSLTWQTWRLRCAPGGIYVISTTRPTPTQKIAGAGSVRHTEDVVLRDPEFELVEVVGSFTILRRRQTP